MAETDEPKADAAPPQPEDATPPQEAPTAQEAADPKPPQGETPPKEDAPRETESDEATASEPAAEEDLPSVLKAWGEAAAGANPHLGGRRLSLTHGVLLLNAVVLGLCLAVFLTVLVAEPPQPAGAGFGRIEAPTPVVESPTAPVETPDTNAPADTVSWSTAEAAYADAEYAGAAKQYLRLIARHEKSPADVAFCDFLRVRLGSCLVRLGRTVEAREQLEYAARSHAPLVRAVAPYHLAMLDMTDGQYLSARRRACEALGTMGNAERFAGLRAECEFLVARALTHRALMFFNAAIEEPETPSSQTDPFSGLNETRLRAVLAAGLGRLANGAVNPQFLASRDESGLRRWNIACFGAPLEELLCRMAGAPGTDIRWQNVEAAARQRPVVLSMANASDHDVIEVACGTAGLIARFTGNDVQVHDPAFYTATADLRGLVLREAVSAWCRSFLRNPAPHHKAYGHLALGMLYEHDGALPDAIDQYRLCAAQYERTRVASLARLRMARVRLALNDHIGARTELLALLDRYPGFPKSDEVYLDLGRAYMAAGQLDEAAQTFRKLYYLELSASSQRGACLGAGDAYFRLQDHDKAREWLQRYLTIAEPDLHERQAKGYFLLAQSEAAQGQLPEAVRAFERALASDPTPTQRFQTLLELARILALQDRFAAALGVLRQVEAGSVPRPIYEEALLIKAQILRSMGLADKAVRLLRPELKSISSRDLAARMALELAGCYADLRDFASARDVLTATLPAMKPGPIAYRAAADLGRACLETGKTDGAITVCLELLQSACSAPLRKQAYETLGQAYLQTRDYARAALAFSGTLPGSEGAGEP